MLEQHNILSQILLRKLKEASSEFGHMYRLLLGTLEVETLNYQMEYMFSLSEGKDKYFKEDGKDSWFKVFHKCIRQTDFFNNCFKTVTAKLISDDEEKEFRFLLNKVKAEGYNKYATPEKNLGQFTPEYNRYLNLHSLRSRQEKDYSLSGVMDSLLYNMIHIDNGFLYKTFQHVFSEYKIEHEPIVKQ